MPSSVPSMRSIIHQLFYRSTCVVSQKKKVLHVPRRRRPAVRRLWGPPLAPSLKSMLSPPVSFQARPLLPAFGSYLWSSPHVLEVPARVVFRPRGRFVSTNHCEKSSTDDRELEPGKISRISTQHWCTLYGCTQILHGQQARYLLRGLARYR